MKKIYVCSPLRGDYERNIENAKRFSREVVLNGHLPITPHIYFTQFTDDKKPKERRLGLDMGLELLKLVDEVWVFGDVISEGMRVEINLAKKLNIPIYYKEILQMKRCLECGCHMDDTHESDICEVCTEEMGGLSSDRVRVEMTDTKEELC